jgi:hypothetical protein
MDEFRQWVEIRKQTIAARELRRSQGTISKWLSAGEIPGESVRHVENVTGIDREKLNSRLYG